MKSHNYRVTFHELLGIGGPTMLLVGALLVTAAAVGILLAR